MHRVHVIAPRLAQTILTDSAMRPTARLAAKMASLLFAANAPVTSAPENLDRHRALERRLVEVGAARRIDHLAAIHHGEMVAQFLRKVEILLDQHDRDLPEIAQIARSRGRYP